MGLEVFNVEKSFNGRKVVDKISFKMDKPGVFGLIGSNGAGKTTIIRMILGILKKDLGIIEWNGKSVKRENVNFGYLPEERGIYPKAKISEQLEYFGKLKGMGKNEAKETVEKWCKKLGVYEYIERPAEQLSKGNQQKVQLITALIHNPELIILDEPFSGLDPINTKIIKEVIDELIKKGVYIVLSSHQMPVVEEYCSDILIMCKGKTVIQGNLAEIKKTYGKNNVVISADSDIKRFITPDIDIVDRSINKYELKIKSEEEANKLLRRILNNDININKFEMKEPSLQEIFIEKVGEAQ